MKSTIKVPIGIDSFRKLVTTSDIFVDKSLFIQEVLEVDSVAILITRPRRWGKSLALDMLETFLAIETDENGKKSEINSNRMLFEQLKIAQEKITIKNEATSIKETKNALDLQGQYPVIKVNFKDVRDLTYEKINKLLKNSISESFAEHHYLRNSSMLNQYQKSKLEKYYESFLSKDLMDEEDLKSSLKFLSELLECHYKKKVYILVDEYDKPVNYFLEKDFAIDKNVRDKVVNLVETILSKCGKSNHHLQKIILTGIFDSLEKEGSSGFNNVVTYGITSPFFGHHFGFSVEEINNLLLQLQIQTKEEKIKILDNIKNWYNGYTVPTFGGKYIQAYTPWAVMRYLSDINADKTIAPQNYWVQSGASTVFQTLLKKEDCAESPFINSLLNITTFGKVTLEYNKATSLFKYDLNTANKDESIFSYLLLNSGYLTSLSQNETHISLAIPNYEVKKELQDVFNKHIKTVRNKKGDICEKIQKEFNKETTKQPTFDLVKSIISEDAEGLTKYIQEVNFENSNYAINLLHLSALTGNSDIFNILYESNKFKKSLFEKSANLTVSDYAYMSSNQELFNFIKNTYGAKLSLELPNKMDFIMCPINYISTGALSVVTAAGVGEIMGALGLIPNIPIVIINHPYLLGAFTVTALLPFIYSRISDYTDICDNYYNYKQIDLLTPISKDLDSFIKYRLLHNETSYVKLGTQCNGEDIKKSQFDSDIIKYPTSEMNHEDNFFSIVMCSKSLAHEEIVESYAWQNAGVCVAQIATLGFIAKFAYVLYQLSGPVLTAHGVHAAATGPLVAGNTIAKQHEIIKIGGTAILEMAEIWLNPYACIDTIGNMHEYIAGE